MIELFTHRLFLSSVSLFISLILSIYLIKRYRLTRYQVLVFILLVLFWSSINIIRAYRKAYAGSDISLGGLGMDGIMAANVAAAYGLISIFVRLPIFALSDYFKSRKFFIALALVFVFVSSIAVVINPNYMTLLTSSLALGFGASMLSLFNVLFAESFDTKDAIVSVSILSVAPLLAEFLVAPLQYAFTATKPNQYTYLWLSSALIALIALAFLYFIQDNKAPTRNFTQKRFMEALKNPVLISLSLLGIVVSFIRFASSGSNLVNHAKLELIQMHPFLVAYLDVAYAMAQLTGGVLMGVYLKRKIGVKWTLLLGIALSGIFAFVLSFSTQAWLIFVLTPLNGFGYGLSYNVLLGMVLQSFKKNLREITMGIYQTFFALGIYYGDKVYAFVIQILPKDLSALLINQQVYQIIAVLCVVSIVFIAWFFHPKRIMLEERYD